MLVLLCFPQLPKDPITATINVKTPKHRSPRLIKDLGGFSNAKAIAIGAIPKSNLL